MINRFFRRTRGPSNASSEVQWQTSSSEKAPSLPDIGKLRDFYVSGSQRNWESSADKIWFVNSFEEHVAPLLEARETTQKSARPPRPSTKPPLNPPHSEPPAPPPPPPTNEQFTPPGGGGSEGEKPGTAVVASLGSPGKDEEKYLLARYGDNGLETQWRTAVNELESTRAHRDVLTEELASARSEVEDMKQQLLASMSETKKALRTQLSAARGEVEALRAQLLAADKGEGALPATSGSAEGAMAMQASENLHHRQLSIMKNKTWNAKPKKGCKFSENLTAVKEFIIPASFEGNEYESVDGRYHRGISIASETDGGGGPVEQLASASESSNAMQPRNSTSSTTMHLFQGKELAKLINGNKQRRASSGGATTKDNNNAATAGTQPPAATVPSDLVPAASEGSNAAPMSSGAGRILSKLKKSDSYPLEGWESSSANLMIISDLDGTLLPAPKKVNGKVVHPIMSEGAAYAPLMRLLEFGATIVGVTGSRLTMHKPRFWDELPLSARKEGRVLLFCETGMVLYRPDENTGEPIEDETYGPFPGNEKRFLRTETVDGLVAAARQGLREWFSDLRDDRTLLEEGHFLHALAERWADEDAPVTLDASQTPRIELRGPSSTKVVGVMIAGIPLKTPRGSGLPDKYLTSKFKPFENEIHGQPTGRLCYDCVVPGLSKHLVLNYLLRTGVLTKGAAFALADSPAGNDVGLTQFHDCGMPFVSVSADVAKCPEHLRSCHVGGNERGSGAFLQEVVKQWGSVGEGGFHRLKGSDGRLTVRKVEELAEAAAEAL